MIARRGFSMLEISLAVGLLATAVATILGGYQSMRELSHRNQERLNATEVAHRLLLIYMHEGPSAVPDEGEAIEYGKGYYRFRLQEDVLQESPDTREGLSVKVARPMSTLSTNKRFEGRLTMVTVSVYPDQVGPVPAMQKPLAALSRTYDPFDMTSVPDDVLLDIVRRRLGGDFEMPPAEGEQP